ncbi:replication protein P [Orbus mooreae]|uniref:replication protein P n=1 Tax=Orbus mooreae TaxID=3074107 RepID=UPI00370DBAF4
MKNISDLVPVITKVDSCNDTDSSRDKAVNTVDKLFEQLKSAFPAMFYQLNDGSEEKLKRQWVIAFVENKISPSMLNAGMRIARRQTKPFLPPVGLFIEWCEQGLIEQYGLPSPADLINKVFEYSAARGFDDFHEFNFGSDANYWLITDLYQAMRDENLGLKALTERAYKLTFDLAKKLMNGYVIPSPKKSLPKTVNKKPLTRDQQLSKVSEIKRKFGFSYASQKAATTP